jgi:hypothetical protein
MSVTEIRPDAVDHAADHVNVWQRCHGCEASPIFGVRYACRTCPAGPDNHLCAACFAKFQAGTLLHPAVGSHARSLLLPSPHCFAAAIGVPRARLASWASVPTALAPAPDVPDRFVLRPEFRSAKDASCGSFAFAIQFDGEPDVLIVTALHVLDEIILASGVDCSPGNRHYTGEEVPRVITRVVLYDVSATNWMLAEVGSAWRMLVLPAARIGEEEPYCQRDIAAFVADQHAPLHAGQLAADPPAVGEPVWLAAPLGDPDLPRTLPGVVVEASEAALVFRFVDSRRGPRFTSGAPIVNQRGQVAGINIGAGLLDGARYGHAHHVGNMRRHLMGAIAMNRRRA